MSKYTVSKISDSSWNMDGSDIYEYSKNFNTWAELARDMHSRDQYANEMFTGKGSAIYRGDMRIGNIKDFYHHEAPINKTTLSEFITLNDNW